MPLVRTEIQAHTIPNLRFSTAIENGKLEIIAPNKTFLERASEQANLVGDAPTLSPTDLHILALALQLKARGYYPIIATDDYAIQNVADQMNFEFLSLGTLGIRRRWQWARYCPACHRKYSADSKQKECEICGTKLRRKPEKKSQLSSHTSLKK